VNNRKLNRRGFLRFAALGSAAGIIAACKPETVVETVVKEVEKVVKETVIVEGTPKVVERVVKETVIVEKEAEEPIGFQGTIMYHGGSFRPQESTGPGSPARIVPQVLADEWQAMHPGVTIEFVDSPAGQAPLEWVQTQLLGGTGPDIFALNPIFQTELVDQGKLVPLNDWMEMPNKYEDDTTPWKETFLPPFLNSTTTRSPKGLYGCAPLGVVSTGIFCNLDMLAEAGIDFETAMDWDIHSPSSWADWMDWHRAVIDAGYSAFHDGGYGFRQWWAWGVMADQLLWEYRETLDRLNYHENLPMEGQETMVNLEEIAHAYYCLGFEPWREPAVQDMFRIFKEWSDFFVEGWTSISGGDAVDSFCSGDLAMIWQGSWAVQQLLTDDRRDFEFSSFWLPPVTQETSVYAQDPPILPIGIGGYGMTSLSLHHVTPERGNVEECVDWLMFLTETKNNEALINEVPQFIPANRKAKALPEIQSLFVGIERFEGLAHQGHPVLAPSRWFGTSGKWEPTFYRECEYYWLGERTLDETVVELEALTANVAPDLVRNNAIQYSESGAWDLTQWECEPDL